MKLLILTLSIACLAVASAQEKIESAFGKKLGDVFDPAKAIGKADLSDGLPKFEFTPENPFRSLQKYYVVVAPTTMQICEIRAVGSFKSSKSSEMEQAVIMALLEKKYGDRKELGSAADMLGMKQIVQGNRAVLTVAHSQGISLVYSDNTLKALAEKERIAIEAAKAKADGL